MKKGSLDSLRAFAAVARDGSFTQAAARLGVSQPALSRAIRALEARLETRLLNRSTRSVALTEAGAALLAELTPALDIIDGALERLSIVGDTISGNVRLTADRHGYDMILAPALPQFLSDHPRVTVEVSLNDAFVNVVDGFDAGLRLGGFVELDMIAVRVGRDVEIAVVGSPAYFTASQPAPGTPRDLARHSCIGYRNSRTGGRHTWTFEKDGQHMSVRAEGPLVLDDGAAILTASLDGVGLAYLFLDQVTDHLAAGSLVRVLADWCPPLPGFRIYYPDRRHQPPALAALTSYLQGRCVDWSS